MANGLHKFSETPSCEWYALDFHPEDCPPDSMDGPFDSVSEAEDFAAEHGIEWIGCRRKLTPAETARDIMLTICGRMDIASFEIKDCPEPSLALDREGYRGLEKILANIIENHGWISTDSDDEPWVWVNCYRY